MFTKLQDRLLTNYPLLWNTRVVWMLGVLAIVHILFFFSGFGAVTPSLMSDYYSLSSAVFTPGMFTFSVLCSLGIIIIWLVFYLRNNAFKSFYIIGKYHSVKEFCIITVIVFLSITFFESYRLGIVMKTRTITSKEELVKEANTANLARAFIPFTKGEYFKINTCGGKKSVGSAYNYDAAFNYYDTSHYTYNDSTNARIRVILDDPDALSYKNYCRSFIDLEKYKSFIPDSQWMATRDRWIDNHRKDSIKYLLDEFIAVCKKYQVRHNLNTQLLTDRVFADSFHNVSKMVLNNYSSYYPENSGAEYLIEYDLERALEFVDECHLNDAGHSDHEDVLVGELYVVIYLSILLLCYRLYSRRVFLISVIGSIVWSIIFALFAASSGGGNGITIFYILLFSLFLILALISLKSDSSKTITGVLLAWHIYMLPFVLMLIVWLITDNYSDNMYAYRNYNGSTYLYDEAAMKQRYPVSHWVYHNIPLLFRLNLLFVFLYTAFFFTRLSKKWHIMPEE